MTWMLQNIISAIAIEKEGYYIRDTEAQIWAP